MVLETEDLGGRTGNGLLFDGSAIWVGTAATDGIKKIRPSDGGVLCSITTGPGPNVLAYDGTVIWVGNTALGSSDSVTRVRASDCAVVGSTTVRDGPHFGALDRTGSLWVANSDSRDVQELDSSGVVVRTIPVATLPLGTVWVDDSIWVASRESNLLTEIRASNGQVLATVFIAGNPEHLGYDGANLWVSLRTAGQVAKLDKSSGAVLATFDVGALPEGIASDGSNIWVANSADGTLTKLAGVAQGVFVTAPQLGPAPTPTPTATPTPTPTPTPVPTPTATATPTPSATVDGLNGALSVTVSPDGKHLYAAGQSDDAVAVFSRDSTTGALTFVEVQRDGVGGVDGLLEAHWVTVSPDGKHLYAAGQLDDAVAVFSRDSTTGALTFVEVHKDGAPASATAAPPVGRPEAQVVSAQAVFLGMAGLMVALLFWGSRRTAGARSRRGVAFGQNPSR